MTNTATPVFGFIGTGNMGGALARAVARGAHGGNMLLADHFAAKAAGLADELNGLVPDLGAASVTAEDIARKADFIVIGVKPQGLDALFQQIAGILAERASAGSRFVLVSMCAGQSIESVLRRIGAAYPIIRIMPNTPASIGEAMITYASSEDVSDAEKAAFLEAFSPAGKLMELPEHLIDAACALSGCGPAFVDLFVEALADGGVLCGLGRAQALELAAQTVMGSAKLILETGSHPGVLKDAVCSPGGTTIEGVRALEANGFRSAAMEAVIAAYQKNFDL